MQTGKIAKLMDKGFGFISYEGSDKDLFFHMNELVDVDFNDLKEGEEVEFEIGEGPKGPNATQVKRV
jgi:CspA family cold shock protein